MNRLGVLHFDHSQPRFSMPRPIFLTSPPRDKNRPEFLRRLYGVRGFLALIWSCSFAMISFGSLSALAVMVAAYPLLDALASWREHVESRPGVSLLTQLNAWLSLVISVTLLLITQYGASWALGTFGVWAILSGAAQFFVALSRRRSTAAAQWPMYVAGSLSMVAGATYVFKATQPEPQLKVFAVYAAGGGIFFIIQSILLWWRGRRV